MNKIIPSLIMAICLPLLCFCQTFDGKILDADGHPITAAYVYNMTAKDYALTNELGYFQLKNAKLNDTITVHHLAFENKKIILTVQDYKKSPVITLQPSYIDLAQITISNNPILLNTLTDFNLNTNPVKSSQEILQQVPGLIIGQHAGGGKAEQLFLRGFDIDHGTDVALSVDGMPVNMVSHAHGQGYADLHFVIPELVEKIDYGKGTYYGDKGNFTTAGYVDLKTKERLEESSIGIEYGQFNTKRIVALLDVLKASDKHEGYIAGEFLGTDGYFDSPQNFSRINLVGKYSASINDADRLSLTASHFQSEWTASGQIPQRAVDSGLISRFGAIDDTEGGRTHRTNFLADYTKSIDNNTFIKSKAYYANYGFELYSNFTFFLNDPINGDQIKQQENRHLMGLESILNKNIFLNNVDISLKAGVGIRQDIVEDVELSHTLNRTTTLDRIAYGDVSETNGYSFIQSDFHYNDWLINTAARIDYFRFNYLDELEVATTRASKQQLQVSPKLNVFYNPNSQWQFFLKSGIGFHSNDSRVVVASGDLPTLPKAYGTDLGFVWKPTSKLVFNTALWYLQLEQEFVYVGDEGIVEPSGRTRRLGIDFGAQYQLNNWLFLNTDFNYAHARSLDDTKGNDYIPLAPILTSSGGFSVQHPSGLSGSLRYRYVSDRPANEDFSITATGYFITDASVNYRWKNVTFGVAAENIFNTEWNETQFATNSRLQFENQPVEEIHFTPGTPFFVRGKVTYAF